MKSKDDMGKNIKTWSEPDLVVMTLDAIVIAEE
jgi:hypothetical protein